MDTDADESSNHLNSRPVSQKDVRQRNVGGLPSENGSEYDAGSIVYEQVKMKKEVGLIGGISLIVGTIIGSGIFISPKGVLDMTGSVGLSLIVWSGSGVLALLGSLCYAELGTLVKKSGGEYAYIMEAFGAIPAFLFAWTSVIVIRTSSIAIICLTFAEYTAAFFPYCGTAQIPIKLVAAVTIGSLCYAELGTLVKKSGGEYAYIMEAFGAIPAFLFSWTSIIVIKPSSIAIICLTFAEYTAAFFPYCGTAQIPIKLVAAVSIVTLMIVNSYSVNLSNKVQVLFTFAKLGALCIIIVGGIIRLAQGYTYQFDNSFEGTTSSPSVIALAFYQALWAYDGWNNLNYVTEEIDQPEKNLPRANVIGVVLVTVVYILTNISYLTVLTTAELLESSAVAVTWGDRILGGAAIVLPLSVLFSTFGAANGTVFTGGRVVYVAGREGHLPELLSFVHARYLTPMPSIIFTCLISLVMISISNISSLVDFFSFTAWLFYGTAVASLLVLRYTKRDVKRVVKVPIVIPIVFVLCALFLVIAPIIDSPQIEFLYAFLFVIGGLVFYIPLVHFKLVSIDKVTIFFQLFLEITPSPYVPDN